MAASGGAVFMPWMAVVVVVLIIVRMGVKTEGEVHAENIGKARGPRGKRQESDRRASTMTDHLKREAHIKGEADTDTSRGHTK